MNGVVEHGDGEEEGDGQGLSQTEPSPVEPDHEKKSFTSDCQSNFLLLHLQGQAAITPSGGQSVCITPSVTFTHLSLSILYGKIYLKIESIFTQPDAHKEA